MNRTKKKLWLPLVLLASIAFPVGAQVKSPDKIKYPALRSFEVPKPQRYTLDNGMEIFLMEDRELPLISVIARIRTGSHYEPADKTGLATMMADVQRSGGTTSMTGDEIDDYLAIRAASVETGMGGTFGSASMNCLKDDFADVLKVFADVLRNPAFDEEKLKVSKAQARAAIARRNDDIGGITAREFTRLIYGEDSPLGRNVEYATLDAIAREDLSAWHRTYYHPNNVMLGVYGDFDSAEMRKRLEATFGNWQRGGTTPGREIPHRKQTRPGVFFVEKQDTTQANLALGHLGITYDNPDYFAVQVMNEVLSGSFASRLFSEVRSKKGLAYSVRGSIGASHYYPGVFRVGMQTKSETMAEGVDALMTEIVGMIERPPSSEELALAKESILNSFVFNFASPAQVLSQQLNYAYYGLPADFLDAFQKKVRETTAEDVARVAKKYIQPDQLTILVVGKPEDFDKPVESLGEVTAIDITIPAPEATGPEVVRSAANLERGRELLGRVARALGGDGAGAVETVAMSSQMSLSMGGQKMAVGRSMQVAFPDRARQVIKTPMGEQVIVLTSQGGFMSMGGQVQEMPAGAAEEGLRDLSRELVFIVRYHGAAGTEAVAAGSDRVEGIDCDVVAVTVNGVETTLCVDGDGRVLKQRYQGAHPPQRTPGTIERIYSDYRELDGRQVPHRQVLYFEGEEVLSMALESFDIGAELDDALFEKP